MVDVVDLATAEIAAFNSSALAECRKKRLRALRSHRKCAICGAPIPPERRKAVPGVRLCVDCQEEAERGNH
nr:MAG TPA: DNA-directed RNA polymerase subunit alpha [Caudoviricetes sp.]